MDSKVPCCPFFNKPMPRLIWDTKRISEPAPSDFYLDSVIYPGGVEYPNGTPTNRLVLGENLAVMSTLLPEYEGAIDLIYADPPFFSNKRYKSRIGRNEDSRRPADWQLGEGYQDAWDDIESYLDMLYPRLYLMYRLLSPTGTLYLHLDWHASHYAKILLDELFGAERFLNEIVWIYHGPSPIRSAFKRKHDTILVYTKSKHYTFNADAVREPYHPNTIKTFASSPKAGFGKKPNLKQGKVPEDWWYFPVVARLHKERTGYPTQKPEALLRRIILASSNPGDLVADFFCGSGTTPIVAGSLGRRFIASDMQWYAIFTTITRCIDVKMPPFRVEIDSRFEPHTKIVDAAGVLNYSKEASILEISPKKKDDFDYWEVDPGWDGKVFRSAFQAKRLKKGKFSTKVPLSFKEKDICVRLVKPNGERVQVEIKKNQKPRA